MKLSTIWSLKYMSTTERLRRTRDWAAQATAMKLPKRVKYWAAMQSIARATRDSEDIMGTPVEEVIKNLDAPKNLS